MTVRVQHEDFDAGAEIAALRRGNPRVGAVASFIGVARDVSDGDAVATLTLEHYPGMTERALEGICAQARGRWNVIDLLVVHRIGELKPTDQIVLVAVTGEDQIVLVAVTGEHRGEAFAACEFVMDYLKTEAPFWKKETGAAGDRWVDARTADDAARDRWKGTP
jgi:molybdopterin synthase catalytic subunit